MRSTTLLAAFFYTQGESPKFEQIYFIDDRKSEMATRSAIVYGLKPDIVRGINQLQHESNHYAEVFKVAKEILNKKIPPLILNLLLMKPKDPQMNTPGSTIDLLVMR